MRSITSFALTTVFTLQFFSHFKSGDCIDCYQCTSTDLTNPYQCNEFMEEDDVNIIAEPCSRFFHSTYCIKRTGRLEGGIGTTRFCSEVDLGNHCEYIQLPGDKIEYRSCVYTCDSDGCNSSHLIKPAMSAPSLILLVIWLTWR